MSQVTLTKKEVAYMLNVDQRSLTSYQKQKVDPLPIFKKGTRGRAHEYDLKDVHEWGIRRKMPKEEGEEDGTAINYEKERARLTKEQADQTALKNAQLRNELAPVDLLAWTLSKLGTQISAILDAIPLKVKKRIPKLTSTQIEVVRREIVKAKNTASRVTVDPDEFAEYFDNTESDRKRARNT